MTGEEWVHELCQARGIDWSRLTAGERTQITMHIPCTIRCWRVGVSIEVKPGEDCPECGRHVDLMTSWEKIPLEI